MADTPKPHCASEWGGRETGPILYTVDEVREMELSGRLFAPMVANYVSTELAKRLQFLHIVTDAEKLKQIRVMVYAIVRALAPPPTTRSAPAESKPGLQELADRIDHEQNWRRPFFERSTLTQDQRDRLDAAVMLRRYAELLPPDRWILFKPGSNVSFSAQTLAKVTEMAYRDVSRGGEPMTEN